MYRGGRGGLANFWTQFTKNIGGGGHAKKVIKNVFMIKSIGFESKLNKSHF